MTSDALKTIRAIAIASGLGAGIVVLGAARHAHGSPLKPQVFYDSDGRQIARVAAPKKAHHRGRTERMDRVARHRVHDRHLPFPVTLRVDDPRPRAWCGWQMRQWLGIRDRSLNLARNWARVGRPARPAPGVVVVWRHHVGIIVAVTARGRAIVKSGNDGGQVRERERSITNAIAFREV